MINKQQKVERARDLFLEGYNCSQAVAAAFTPEMGLDVKTVLRLSSGFGGGMGGLRNTCGAVSGMCMALSMLRGYDEADDMETKKHLYATVQHMALQFEERFSTLVCRDLLALNGIEAQKEPSERTPEYYRTRPCARYVEACAAILCDTLNEGEIE